VLGPDWGVEGEHLVQLATGERFVLVPGGWLRRGLSLADLAAATTERRRAVNDDWLGLLEHPKKGVRLAATLPLAVCDVSRPQLLDALSARLEQEKDRAVIAGLLLAQHTLGGQPPDLPRRSAKKVATLRPLLRAMAGAVDVPGLIAAMDQDWLGGLGWFGGSHRGAALTLLRQGTEEQRLEAATTLMASPGPTWWNWHQRAALLLMFPTERVQAHALLLPDALSDTQRQVLAAYVPAEGPGQPLPWRKHGLPASSIGRAVLLGEDDGPWSQIIPTADGPLPLFFALTRLQEKTPQATGEQAQRLVDELLGGVAPELRKELDATVGSIPDLVHPPDGVMYGTIRPAWPRYTSDR